MGHLAEDGVDGYIIRWTSGHSRDRQTLSAIGRTHQSDCQAGQRRRLHLSGRHGEEIREEAGSDMAVTKTHPIKSALKAAIDYICNPDKTDRKLVGVPPLGCAAETADIEFAWTRRHAIRQEGVRTWAATSIKPLSLGRGHARGSYHRIGIWNWRRRSWAANNLISPAQIDRDRIHVAMFKSRSVRDRQLSSTRRATAGVII